MTFEQYDENFLNKINLTPFLNDSVVDLRKKTQRHVHVLSHFKYNDNFKKIFFRPAHYSQYVSSEASLRGVHHSSNDFHDTDVELKDVKDLQRNGKTVNSTARANNEGDPANSPMISTVFNAETPSVLLLSETSATQTDLFNMLKEPVSLSINAKLDGKFYLNSRFLSKTSSDTYPIACYRRNYNSLDINLNISSVPSLIAFNNSNENYHIENLFLDISCSCNFSDNAQELLFFNVAKSPSNALTLSNTSFLEPFTIFQHRTPLSLLTSDNGNFNYTVKRFQFKKATPNNGKFIVKDYYYLHVKIVAEATLIDHQSGQKRSHPLEFVVRDLCSQPISVRGRNPSFYNNRDDILVPKCNYRQNS